MKLPDYLNTFSPRDRAQEIKRISQCLKVTREYVYSMINGRKRIPEKYALALEYITRGKVPREDIAPHMYVKKPTAYLKKSNNLLKNTMRTKLAQKRRKNDRAII